MPEIPNQIIEELKTSRRKPRVIITLSDEDGNIQLVFGEESGLVFETDDDQGRWINSHNNETWTGAGNPDNNEPAESLPKSYNLYPFLRSVGKIKHKVDLKSKKLVIPNMTMKMHNFGIDRMILDTDYYGNGQHAYSIRDEFLTDISANPYWKRGFDQENKTDNVYIYPIDSNNSLGENFEYSWGNELAWGQQVIYQLIGMTVNVYYATDYSIWAKSKTISLERCANMQTMTIKSYKQDRKYVNVLCESSFSEMAQKEIELETFSTQWNQSDGAYKPIIFGDGNYHTLYPTLDKDGLLFEYQDSEYAEADAISLQDLTLVDDDTEYKVPTETRSQSLLWDERPAYSDPSETFTYRVSKVEGIYSQWQETEDHKLLFPYRLLGNSTQSTYSELGLIYVTHSKTPRIQSPQTDNPLALPNPYVLGYFPMKHLAHRDRTNGGIFGVVKESGHFVPSNNPNSIGSFQFMDGEVFGVPSQDGNDRPNAKGSIGILKLLIDDHTAHDNSVVDIFVDLESNFWYSDYDFPNSQPVGQQYNRRLTSYLVRFDLDHRFAEKTYQDRFIINETLVQNSNWFLVGMNATATGFPDLLGDEIVQGTYDIPSSMFSLGAHIYDMEHTTGFVKKFVRDNWTDPTDVWSDDNTSLANQGTFNINHFYYNTIQTDGTVYEYHIMKPSDFFGSTCSLKIIPNSGFGSVDSSLSANSLSSYTSTDSHFTNSDGDQYKATVNAGLDIDTLSITSHFLKDGLLDSVDRMYVKGNGASMADLVPYSNTIQSYKNYAPMQVAYLWKKHLGTNWMGAENMGSDYWKYQPLYQALNEETFATQSYPNTSNYTIKEPKTILSITEDLLKHTNAFPFLYTQGGEEKFATFLIKDTFVGMEQVYDFHLIDMDYEKISIETTPIADICTSAEVIYGGEKAEMNLTKINKTEKATVQDFYPEYDDDFYNLGGLEGHIVLECPNINSLQEANAYRDYYIKNNCNQKIKIKMKLPLKYIELHLGTIIRFDYLPENMRVLGKDYTSSWYALMIDENINFLSDEFDFSDIPENVFQYDENFKKSEIQINGQYFLPFFVITKCDYSVDSIEIEALQLMHLKDYLGSAPQPCDQGTCYANDEVNFPIEGCMIPYADNYSLVANTPTNTICEFASEVQQVPPAYVDEYNIMRAGWVDIKLKQDQLVIPYEDLSQTYQSTGTLYDSSLVSVRVGDQYPPVMNTQIPNTHRYPDGFMAENGNFMGYSVKVKDKFYLFNFYGQQIKIAGEVLKASKIEWIRQI